MPDTVTAPAPARFTHREILLMLSGTMCGMFLGAIDQTIVATALPAMAGELHGIQYMAWAVAAYLLTSTASTPIYGKLSDLYGRRRLFVSAIGIFLLGSIICGAAQSMSMLIGGRAVQGLGGGGLITLAQTIMADMVPPRERGRYQAYFSGVYSVSTLGGPILGGLLVDIASWRWVFWFNLPIAVAGLWICNAQLKRLPIRGGQKQIDYFGASLLVPAIVALLLVTTWGGNEFAWLSPPIIGLVVLALVLIALLILQERRAADPILPLRFFNNNVFVIGNSLAFLMGGATVGATIFLPLFLQVVLGASASNSGLLITPLMVGITIGALLTGRFIRWTGRYKIIPLVALTIAALSFLGMMEITRETSPIYYITLMTALGIGLGPAGPMISISVQNSVEMRDLGSATSLTSFFRSMGGSFGVAMMGAILFAGLTEQSANLPGLNAGGLLHGGPAMIAALPENVRAVIVASFTQSFRYVYLVGAATCILGVALAVFLKELPLRRWGPPAQSAEAPPQAAREAAAAPAFAKSDSEP
jgi:EmrB/QacA subfamily drug resistance transporter